MAITRDEDMPNATVPVNVHLPQNEWSESTKTAGLKDVVDRIVKRIRDSDMAQRMIDRVTRYFHTQNPADDLTPQEVSSLYRGEDYGDDFDVKGGKELDVGWTNHAEYRSDLRDIQPSLVNEAVRDFVDNHSGMRDHRKVKLVKPGVGKAVVDIDTTREPEEAAVVTVMASMPSPRRRIRVEGEVVGRRYVVREVFVDTGKVWRTMWFEADSHEDAIMEIEGALEVYRKSVAERTAAQGETYGVFVWTEENRYPAKDAVKVFRSKVLAQRYADVDPEKNYVVRTIWNQGSKEVDVMMASERMTKIAARVVAGEEEDAKAYQEYREKSEKGFEEFLESAQNGGHPSRYGFKGSFSELGMVLESLVSDISMAKLYLPYGSREAALMKDVEQKLRFLRKMMGSVEIQYDRAERMGNDLNDRMAKTLGVVGPILRALPVEFPKQERKV